MEFRGYLEAEIIRLREAPIETPGAIGTVERDHAPLRPSYNCIRQIFSKPTTNADCFSMAVFEIDGIVSPKAIFPMILV